MPRPQSPSRPRRSLSCLFLLKPSLLLCCFLDGPRFFPSPVWHSSSLAEAKHDVPADTSPEGVADLYPGSRIGEGQLGPSEQGNTVIQKGDPFSEHGYGQGDRDARAEEQKQSGTVNVPTSGPSSLTQTLRNLRSLDPHSLWKHMNEVIAAVAQPRDTSSPGTTAVSKGRRADTEVADEEDESYRKTRQLTARESQETQRPSDATRHDLGKEVQDKDSQRMSPLTRGPTVPASDHSPSYSSEEGTEEGNNGEEAAVSEDVETAASSGEGTVNDNHAEKDGGMGIAPLPLPRQNSPVFNQKDIERRSALDQGEESSELMSRGSDAATAKETKRTPGVRASSRGFIPPTRLKAQGMASTWPCKEEAKLVFLFVNSASGGGGGKKWVRRVGEDGSFVKDFVDICSRVMVYDLHMSSSLGFQALRDVTHAKKVLAGTPAPLGPDQLVRVIAIGGDGTVMWVNREAIAHEVVMPWTAVGIVGFGTGNDFAQSYGWHKIDYGGMDINDDAVLRRAVEQWQDAGVGRHDIWKVRITASEGGYFSQIDSKTRQLVTVRNPGTDVPAKVFETPMNLYFGIGFDSLVGMEFDRMRSTSRARNRIMYALAFFKFFRLPWRKVTDQVETIYVLQRAKKHAILTTNPNKYPNTFRISDAISMTFLNNRSMIGGVPLWRSSGVSGVKPPLKISPGNTTRFNTFNRRLLRARQSMGDGKIELIMFHSRFRLMRSVVMNGDAAARLLQHRGPLLVSFYPEEKGGPVAFQVDGEFRLCHRAKYATVEYERSFNVLRNTPVD